MNLLKAKQALSDKLDIDFANIALNGLFTESELADAIHNSSQLAWNLHNWEFTLGSKTSTITEDNMAAGYVDYPLELDNQGVKLLVIGGKEFSPKTRYPDFRKFLEDNPDTTDRLWTRYGRFLFINMKAVSLGDSYDVYGKLRCPSLTTDDDLLPFSPDTDSQENSGNRAIVDLAYADLLESDKLNNPTKAAAIRSKALGILDMLWKPEEDASSDEQSKDRPAFDVPDFFSF